MTATVAADRLAIFLAGTVVFFLVAGVPEMQI